MTNLSELRPYATPRQFEVLQAVIENGTYKKAAAALGINPSSVSRSMTALHNRAALRGYAPDHDMTHPVPDGFKTKGVSTLYDEAGNIAAQWVKSEADRERQLVLMQQAVESMCETIKAEKPVKAPKATIDDLCNLYPITDYHLGSYAWREETGADWDTQIAEDLLTGWFTQAIASAPAAQHGVLALMGDFLHYDSMEAVTPEHRNILDADTRFELVVRIAIRSLRRVVRMLLSKHERLHIIIAEGNHDPASSAWMREMFAALYDDEPRVTVDRSPDPYYCVRWGQTFLGVHHGHKRKANNIDHVFAAKFREEFGQTKHAYIHTGHLHHAALSETTLAIVEQHRTLAAPDAYASRGGWISGRGASVITYSKRFGEVGRVTISPEMCATS